MIAFALATPQDHEGIMAVIGAAFDPLYGEAWNAGQIRTALVAQDRVCEVARKADQIIGFSLARYAANEAELLLVAVLPDHRRNGIATTLISRASADVERRGAHAIFLEVRDANHAACALYRTQGFAPVGRRKAYYAGQDRRRYDAITMRRCLKAQSSLNISL